MPDNNPETKIHIATVNSIVRNEKRANTSHVTIEAESIGKFPLTIYGVFDALLSGIWEGASWQLETGKNYKFHLVRGNRKEQHKDSPGDQDWMYFQNIHAINPLGANPSEATPVTQPNVWHNSNETTWTPNAGDQWRADGQETGNARTNATSLTIAYYERNGEMPDDTWIAEAAKTVNKIAQAIRSNVEEPEPESESEYGQPF